MNPAGGQPTVTFRRPWYLIACDVDQRTFAIPLVIWARLLLRVITVTDPFWQVVG